MCFGKAVWEMYSEFNFILFNSRGRGAAPSVRAGTTATHEFKLKHSLLDGLFGYSPSWISQ